MKIINNYVIIIRSIDNCNLNQEVKLIEFLISIILVLILSLQFTKFISKNAKILYFMAYIIGFLIIVYRLFFIQTVKLPVVISQIERVIAMGAFTGAMFAIVMYTGALDNKKSYTKKLMSIRAELSIIASILFLSHTIPYCVTFFKNISKMDMSQLSTIVYPTVDHVPGLRHIVFLVEDRGTVRHGRVEADKAGDEGPQADEEGGVGVEFGPDDAAGL